MMGRPPRPTRPLFVAALRRDVTLKEAAQSAQVSVSYAQRWAAALGFRRMYVTEKERRLLLDKRRGETRE